jgi:hypothetical protein
VPAISGAVFDAERRQHDQGRDHRDQDPEGRAQQWQHDLQLRARCRLAVVVGARQLWSDAHVLQMAVDRQLAQA